MITYSKIWWTISIQNFSQKYKKGAFELSIRFYAINQELQFYVLVSLRIKKENHLVSLLCFVRIDGKSDNLENVSFYIAGPEQIVMYRLNVN